MLCADNFFTGTKANVAHLLDGHAKAMVVADSRKAAVRYKLAIDDHITKKGYGYKLAEADPVKYHAASGKFNPAEGFPKATGPTKTTFTQVFGQWLCDMAEKDQRLVGITPAMREGSGMVATNHGIHTERCDLLAAEAALLVSLICCQSASDKVFRPAKVPGPASI